MKRVYSEERNKKISESKKGKKHTEEQNRRQSERMKGENNPMFGKKHTEETLQKQREIKKGKNPLEETRKKLSEARIGKKHTEKTLQKMRDNHVGMKGLKHTEEARKLMGESRKGEKSWNWDGGYYSNNIPKYDLYAPQLSYAEPVRRNEKDPIILEAKCTYCGKWFIPKRSEVLGRISALEGKSTVSSEARLYCSDECKQECPVYKKQKYSAEEKNTNKYTREVQAELRKMVFERDNWECQKCGSIKSLNCHHIEGIRWDPLESADMDKCITFCKSCHIKIHKIEGCGYRDLRCLQ